MTLATCFRGNAAETTDDPRIVAAKRRLADELIVDVLSGGPIYRWLDFACCDPLLVDFLSKLQFDTLNALELHGSRVEVAGSW